MNYSFIALDRSIRYKAHNNRIPKSSVRSSATARSTWQGRLAAPALIVCRPRRVFALVHVVVQPRERCSTAVSSRQYRQKRWRFPGRREGGERAVAGWLAGTRTEGLRARYWGGPECPRSVARRESVGYLHDEAKRETVSNSPVSSRWNTTHLQTQMEYGWGAPTGL
jgi:hypothetical protein